jgi:hypothetical protein
MKFTACIAFLGIASALVLTAFAADKSEPPKAGPADAKLERFKQLAGDWVGKHSGSGSGDLDGKEVKVNYKVTGNGSAVVETIMPGTDHEMVTVIHKDGDELVLTHYCALGNQPRMKADAKGDGDKIAFKFTGATNLKSEKDPHMHSATFTFVDKDTLKAEWSLYEEGKETRVVAFELKRKK